MLTDTERAQLMQQAITATIRRDADTAIEALNRIGQNSDQRQMYATCCAFAGAAQHALETISGQKIGEDTIAYIQDISPEGHVHDPAEMFAVRFVTARMNGDDDTAQALFQASWNATMEEHVDSVIALLFFTAQWAKLMIDHKRETGEQT